MKILLISMPDTADFIDNAIRLPNLSLVSLAGNLPGHDVTVLDLVLYKPHVRKILEDTINSVQPEIVGLSAMTFQFETLLRVARFIRKINPSIKMVAGGYHATLMAEEETSSGGSHEIDFFVRGEGETTFGELVEVLSHSSPDLNRIKGLSYKDGAEWHHNPDRPLQDLSLVNLPRREVRKSQDFYFLDMPMDVAETSRGCPFNCKFCSITHMYGRTFRRFPVDRIIADLKAIRAQGTKAVFFVDDNIIHDIEHFRQVCQAIVKHGLNDMCYLTQVTSVGIARNPELVADMKRANFRIVFVGIESMEPAALKGMNKPTNPEINREAVSMLRKHGIAVIAGTIAGYPEDTRESIKRQYHLVRKLVPDAIYAQYLTPYPKTVVRQEMLDAGLVTNILDYTKYDGFTCNIRTNNLSMDELYRALKKEAFLSNFDLTLIRNNYFLKKHSIFFLRCVFKTVITNVYNILTGRQYYRHLDI